MGRPRTQSGAGRVGKFHWGYAVQSEEHNQTVTARHVFVMTRYKLKLVSGDGEITEVDRRRTKIIGRIRWIWREL